MSRIRILPERVANQIAAGEVVERPASAVKELVENALDAGATRITVEFRAGGSEFIRIEDDGCGMDRDDALLALQRHATSKLTDASDLERLGTFGFRGEALPSIASVSRFVLRTRAAGDDAGTEVVVNAGKVLDVKSCGRPVGTCIEVSHLFHPVPARRRFLKSDATEAAHIVEVVRAYALAYPAVRLLLVQDGRPVVRSPGSARLEERVAELFGRDAAGALVPIERAEGGWSVSGLISRPGIERASRQDLRLFVNRRPVECRTLSFAVIDAYRESLPKGRYPVAILFMECAPSAVDVNVHPTKREVRFRHDAAVRAFLVRAISDRLGALAADFAPGPAAGAADRSRPFDAGPSAEPPRAWGGDAAPGARLGHGEAGYAEPRVGELTAVAEIAAEPCAKSPAGISDRGAGAWRWLGLVQGVYAVFETGGGLILVDRQAAAERVWYERLCAQFREGPVVSQRLLLPAALELDPIGSALLMDARRFLATQGFEFAEFGRNYFRIEAIPDWLSPDDAHPFVEEVLAALRDGRLDARRMDLAWDPLAKMAAARVAGGGAATESDVRRLVSDLFATRLPLTSPAGRPTIVELNRNELSRRFQRS